MTLKLIGAAGALTVLALASGASAQIAPAAAPAVAGPVIPGVCVYSPERAIGTSSAGKAFSARMQQLTQAAEAELKAEGTALENEAKTLEGQRATMPQDQFQQRVLTLQQKGAAFDRKRAQRARELEVTQGKQLQRIAAEAQPLVVQAYGERNCGMLVDASSVLLGNQQMDVTALVIQKLNGKLATVTFDRERLDQPQAAAAPAAKPAAPAKK